MRELIKVLKFAGNLWPYYTIVTISSILVAGANMVGPFVIKAAADMVADVAQGGQPDYNLAIWLAAIYFASDAAITVISNIGGYYGDLMAAKLRQQLSSRYYQHLLQLPQQYYDQELTGTIINRLNRTIAEITRFMGFFANNFFQMFIMLFFTLIIVAFYSWEVALLLFLIYPAFLWMTTRTSKDWQAYQSDINLHTDIASGRFAESISQIKVVKSFSSEPRELKHFDHHFAKTIDITRLQSTLWHKMDVYRRLILNLIFFLILGYILWQTIAGRFSIGTMFLLIQFSSMMRMPLFGMSMIVDSTQRAISGSKDYFDTMAIDPAIADQPNAAALKIEQGQIEYQQVDFAYTEGNPVLNNISFTIQPGQKVALVGESGEGKTTITNLLLRLYEPSHGSICIDNQNIAQVSQSSLRQNIAVVFQDPSIFSGTIRENIAYANPKASAKDIEKAAEAANATDFIRKLKDGLDTEIGEKGVRLSGGQKQRLAIARAFLKDAPILILDEATSSLDSKAEALVQQALERLMKNRTTLIIAHRLSTIANVDQIITLQNGTVDEIGTPSQLAQTNGIYASLLHLQTGDSDLAKKKLKQFEIVTESPPATS